MEYTPETNVLDSITEQTFWQKAVGLSFNPAKDDKVYYTKKKFADVIDMLKELDYWLDWLPTEKIINTAIKEIQTAQMRAVKAITWKEK
jgi:hypothetical protein